MRNLTISIDEKTLEESRRYAKARGMSLNALIRELLRRTVHRAGPGTLEHMWQLSDDLGISSKGKKWTRDELYDV